MHVFSIVINIGLLQKQNYSEYNEIKTKFTNSHWISDNEVK